MSEYLELYDYRQRVAALYHERDRALLSNGNPAEVWLRFRDGRDRLFAEHPQSAFDLEQKKSFQSLPYFPYNQAMRFTAEIDTDSEPKRQSITMNANEQMSMISIGQLQFTFYQKPQTLTLYWLDIYGGGLFLPFKDATAPNQSYGGGRYLFDTIKGSTPILVMEHRRRLLLDFNYAYNPSCAYNARWVCPLAPEENHLGVAIEAGEKYQNFIDLP